MKLIVTCLTILLFFPVILPLVSCNETVFDEQFSLNKAVYEESFKWFFANLSSGDRVSISASVDGNPVRFLIRSGEARNEKLLTRENVNTVSEDWTAPYDDEFQFYFEINEGTAQVHFTLQKVGAGAAAFDPLPTVVVVVIVLLVWFISVLLIVRMRKQPPLPPPAEEPPPPPPV
jgi:hypothetical protein